MFIIIPDLLTAPGLGLTEYPQMYTVWELMDYLPQVMETFIYTSYMDNQKVRKSLVILEK